MRATTRARLAISILLVGTTACAGDHLGTTAQAIEEPADGDDEVPLPVVWLPDVGLAIAGAAYKEPAVKEKIDGTISIRVTATIPPDQPDFSTERVEGWRVLLQPRQRVIYADGTRRVSTVADNLARLRFPVTRVAAWEPEDDGLLPDELETPVTDSRAQHLELSIDLCSDLRQAGDPANFFRDRADCLGQAIELALPCGEATPVHVWFDNGYIGERAVTASEPFLFTRTTGAGCGAGAALGNAFAIVASAIHFLVGEEREDPLSKMFIPIAHNIFPGYEGDGVSRLYISIVDRDNDANDRLLIAAPPGKPPLGLPLPAGASHFIVAGFHDDAFDDDGNRTALSEQEVLPCGEPREISIWHEFLNVPGSLTKTPSILFTRTTGRGCEGGRP